MWSTDLIIFCYHEKGTRMALHACRVKLGRDMSLSFIFKSKKKSAKREKSQPGNAKKQQGMVDYAPLKMENNHCKRNARINCLHQKGMHENQGKTKVDGNLNFKCSKIKVKTKIKIAREKENLAKT